MMRSDKKMAILIPVLVVFSFSALVMPANTNPLTGPVYVWDQPAIHVQGTEDFFGNAWWIRGNSIGVEFTFTGIDPRRIVSEYLDVMFSLGVTNHMNGEKGLDGLVDVVINPGVDDYLIENVLLDNLDPTNHIYAMTDSNGTYETKAHITIHKSYIHDGELVIEVKRHIDEKDFEPFVTPCWNASIDLGTQIAPTPSIPEGVYDYNDAHTVHIHVATDSTGTVALPGEVVMRPQWLASGKGSGTGPKGGPVYVWDNPKLVVQGTEDALLDGWWVRGNSTGVEFNFTGIDPTRIVSEYFDVAFSLGVTNHMNGEKGLDGLVDVVINPGVDDYLIKNVLFDNLDPTNHIYAMSDSPNGTYETKAHITVHKSYVHNGSLVIKVERHIDEKDMLPAAPVCTKAPIDLGNQSVPVPLIPEGVYDYNDAHTVHLHVPTTSPPGGDTAKAGEVVMRLEWLAPPVPVPTPILTPPGIVALIGLLSMVAISTLVRRKKR